MAKQHLLLVAHDAQALRLMEVSLRQAGFTTTTATDGVEALARLEALRPALVIADAEMPGLDGYDLCVHLKSDARYAEVPFILLADEGSADARIRGLELGADDALTRPIYTRELITRVRMALEREKRRSLSSQHRFFGDLADMSVIDLLQTIEIGGKSGRARITSEGRQGTLWFENGAVADAEAGGLTGEEAVYRLLTWDAGTFEMDFRGTPRARTVEASTPALLMEGVRRMDEWSRVAEQLPGLEVALRVDDAELAEHDLAPPARELIRLFDGQRTVRAVVDAVALPDLDALRLISRLYLEGILAAPGLVAARQPVATPTAEDGELELLEPDWMEESAPSKVPSSPPPRVSGPLARVEPRRPRGLVDDLIRAAANLPVVPTEEGRARGGPPAFRPSFPGLERSEAESGRSTLGGGRVDTGRFDTGRFDTGRVDTGRSTLGGGRVDAGRSTPGGATQPEALRRDLPATRRERPVPPSALRSREEPLAPDEAGFRLREPTPVMVPVPPEATRSQVGDEIPALPGGRGPRLPDATDGLRGPGAEAKSRTAGARLAGRENSAVPRAQTPPLSAMPPPVPSAPLKPVEIEEDLLLARSNRRAIWGVAVLLLVSVGAGLAWLLRDRVEPFAGRVDGPRLGWHKGVLAARPPVSAVPAVPDGPTGQAPPAALPSEPPAPASEPLAPASEPPPVAAESAPAPAPASADAPAVASAPPADPLPIAGDEFGRLVSAGREQSRQGRFAQAATTLTKALKLRPDDVDARLALARARLEAGSDDAALAEAQKVLKRQPQAAEAWLITGTVHQLKNRKQDAAQAYQRYLDLAPTGPSAAELRNILPTLTSANP